MRTEKFLIKFLYCCGFLTWLLVPRVRCDAAGGPVGCAGELGGGGEEVRPPQAELLRRRLRKVL